MYSMHRFLLLAMHRLARQLFGCRGAQERPKLPERSSRGQGQRSARWKSRRGARGSRPPAWRVRLTSRGSWTDSAAGPAPWVGGGTGATSSLRDSAGPLHLVPRRDKASVDPHLHIRSSEFPSGGGRPAIAHGGKPRARLPVVASTRRAAEDANPAIASREMALSARDFERHLSQTQPSLES